jgi:hypothetical protein
VLADGGAPAIDARAPTSFVLADGGAPYVVCARRWRSPEGKGRVKGLSSRAEGRVRVRGVYGFSSLVKQNKKGKKLRCLLLRRIFFFKIFLL